MKVAWIGPGGKCRGEIDDDVPPELIKYIDDNSEFIAKEIMTNWKIQDIALCRRTGRLNLGDVILMVAVASPHPKEAFKACEHAVECMRNMDSVRKKEILK